MAGGNSVLASQNFQAAFWGMFSNQQLGSLKSNPMECRQLANISHLGRPAMLCLISCWRRAVAAPSRFRLPQKLPKGSLKVENYFSGCL